MLVLIILFFLISYQGFFSLKIQRTFETRLSFPYANLLFDMTVKFTNKSFRYFSTSGKQQELSSKTVKRQLTQELAFLWYILTCPCSSTGQTLWHCVPSPTKQEKPSHTWFQQRYQTNPNHVR